MKLLAALFVLVLVGAPAPAQDGSWDIPRDDEQSSPIPLSEPPIPEPVKGVVVDEPDPADALDASLEEEAESAADEQATRAAIALLRAEAARRVERVAGDAEAAETERGEARARGERTDAAWVALEAALLGDEPVAAALDPADVTVGEPAALRVTVPYDAPSAVRPDVEWPGPVVRLVPDADWNGGRLGPTTTTLRADAWVLDTTVQLWREGAAGLDGLRLDVVVPDGLVARVPGDLPLGAVTLALEAPTSASLDLAPTAVRRVDPERLPPVPLPVPPVSHTAVLAIVAAGLALLGWAAWALMPREVVEPVSVVPPDRVAIEALAGLRSRVPQTTDAIPPFVDEVSAVLRRYVEGRFGVAAPDLTTDEFLARAAEQSEVLARRRDVLQPFLTQCDLVKFANHRPSLDAPPALLATAETFVEETRATTADEHVAEPAAVPSGAAA